MNTAEQILVVILAAALALLLVLTIIAVIAIIRLLKGLQILVDKAEHLVGSAEAVGAMVRQTVGKMSLLRLVQNVISMVHHNTGKKGDDKA